MMYQHARAEAQIDLDALTYNIERMYDRLPAHTRIVAVVKADAYGHGAAAVAAALEPLESIFGFAVATVEEGCALRSAGIRKPVMLLGYAFAEQYEAAVRNDLWLVIFNEETARRIARTAGSVGKRAAVQIAVDTGMNRIGYRVSDETAEEISRICRMRDLDVQGMFTHFYASDAADKSSTMAQLARFKEMVSMLEKIEIHIPYLHCSNSAAMIDLPEISMDLVRAGIAMYGLEPSADVRNIGLRPVMTLKARIVNVKIIPAGETVSYGGTWRAPDARRIATIAFGYADGYPRQLSNRGWVLVHGKKAPIRGRVCMDQFMIDVTEIPEAKAEDEVTLIGTDGAETITMEELGDISGRFNYEMACCISKRVPRVYLKDHHKLYLQDEEFMI